MRNNQNTETELQRQAGEYAADFLHCYKKYARRRRIYRTCLFALLFAGLASLVGAGYYYIDSSIPSVIHVRAGQEQSFDLGFPAGAAFISAGFSGESNIPEGAVDVDLSKPVTVRLDDTDTYQLQVNLFGFLPFKQVDICVIDEEELIPVGMPIGIYVKTDGILVVGTGEFTSRDGVSCSPAKGVLKSGDYIRKCNGVTVKDKDTFIEMVEKSGGSAVTLTVERDAKVTELHLTPKQDETGAYKLGVWVRDNAQGVGTMTYVDGEGHFGALGHGINDIDTSTLMNMDDGTLYQTEIISIRKGANGDPGEMTGMIVYADDRILGDITSNSERGIFGVCNQKTMGQIAEKPIPIGLKQEIEKGSAQILCTVDGTARYYDVEITAIHLDHDNINRGIELKVTDQELLGITGGIVQGMSGAPIIQNGKLIGAVTHVLVQDSTRGYGIFIENMLKH